MGTDSVGSEGGEQGDWTQSHVKGQRAASPRGAGSTYKGPGGGEGGVLRGVHEERRPRWEPKLTGQTLPVHCLCPPGAHLHRAASSARCRPAASTSRDRRLRADLRPGRRGYNAAILTRSPL